MNISQLVKKLKAMEMGLVSILAAAMEKHKEELIFLNQQQLYERGTDGEGKKLKRYKNKSYAKKKHRLNPLPGLGVPDLFLKGNLLDSMTLKTQGESFNINSSLYYAKYIFKNYGEQVFKLTKGSKRQGWKIIKPTVLKLIKQQLTK